MHAELATTEAAQPPIPNKPAAPLANLDVDAVVDRIAAGEFQSHIARELGVSPQALHQRVSPHPGYREALKLRNMAKLDKAQGNIEDSAETLDLARAREAWKAAAWRAERECPDEWGAKAQLDVGVSVQVVIADRFSPDPVSQDAQVIDAESL